MFLLDSEVTARQLWRILFFVAFIGRDDFSADCFVELVGKVATLFELPVALFEGSRLAVSCHLI